MKLGTVVMINKKYPTTWRHGDIGVVDSQVFWLGGETAWRVADGNDAGSTILYEDEMDILHVPIEAGDVVMVTEGYDRFSGPMGIGGVGAVFEVLDREANTWPGEKPGWWCTDGHGFFVFYEDEIEIIG